MARLSDDYEDDAQLTLYIWHNYSHLLTHVESLANIAILAEEKATISNLKMARLLQRKWESKDDPGP